MLYSEIIDFLMLNKDVHKLTTGLGSVQTLVCFSQKYDTHFKDTLSNLTFRVPFIVIYSYNKSQQMNCFSNLI